MGQIATRKGTQVGYEVKCPFFPLGHYTAKDETVKGVALKLAEHCLQQHRNTPEEDWPEFSIEALEQGRPTG